MGRLTPRKGVRELILFSDDWQTDEICRKCGALEDVLEKHHIEDAQQLDDALSMHGDAREGAQMAELLKSHIAYCRDTGCFVFENMDAASARRLREWLL